MSTTQDWQSQFFYVTSEVSSSNTREPTTRHNLYPPWSRYFSLKHQFLFLLTNQAWVSQWFTNAWCLCKLEDRKWTWLERGHHYQSIIHFVWVELIISLVIRFLLCFVWNTSLSSTYVHFWLSFSILNLAQRYCVQMFHICFHFHFCSDWCLLQRGGLCGGLA